MASRFLSISSGTQALQACKTRTTVIRQPLGTKSHHTFEPPRNTIASNRRYTTQDKGRPQDPIDKHPVSEETKRSGPATQRQSLLDQMGATRNVKIAVIVFLCIYGTLETIFYAGALYRYFKKEGPTGEPSTD